MKGISCLAFATLFLAVPSAFPQSTATTTTRDRAEPSPVELCSSRDTAAAPVDTVEVLATCTIDKETLRPLQPTLFGRFARAFQYKYEIGEQQRTLVVGSTIVQNPEHYLNQHSLRFDFAELFTTPSDLDDLVQKIAGDPANSKTKTQVNLNVCGQQVLECLAGGGSMWKRALSGLSVTAALSERPGVQQGIILPEPSFTGHYGITGQIDFSPANLFITGGNWKKAITAAKNIHIRPSEIADMEAKVGSPHRNIWGTLFQTFVPTFQFKRTSQFDFVKYGGTLIPAPFPESALNSYTFTWDLRRAIAPTSTRLDAANAVSAIASYQDPLTSPSDDSETKKAKKSTKLCIIYSGPLRSSISVPDTFQAASCQRFAQDVGADHYALACVSDNRIQIGTPYQAKPDRTHSDADQKSKIEVGPCSW